jgi:hypothetical protein
VVAIESDRHCCNGIDRTLALPAAHKLTRKTSPLPANIGISGVQLIHKR